MGNRSKQSASNPGKMKSKFIFVIILIISIKYIYSLDYTIPPNTYSIQSGDFDNDGDDDIVVGHTYGPGCISFLENNGNGEFVLIDTLRPFGSNLIHGIINLDNNITPDIVFDGQNDDSQLLHIIFNNDFSTLFTYSFNLNAPVHPLAFGDLDGDDNLDLVFASWGAGYDNLWGVMYNLGDKEFSEPDWFECPNQASNAGFHELECRDLDNNGFDDIIAYTSPETYIYYSDGSSFEQDSLNCYAANGTMVSEDMDNDGDYDIVVSYMNNGTTFKFYENFGNHEFEYHEQNFEGYYSIAYPCDINNDQYPDIVNIFGGAGLRIHFNTGNFQFYTETIDLTSYGELWTKPTFSDFDGNGTEDIAFIRYGIEENNLTILYNDGDGNFLEEPQVSVEDYDLSFTNYELNTYPNPFNGSVTISYNIKNQDAENTMLEIFNIKGQRVDVLSSSLCHPELVEGRGEIIWNAENHTSGIYLIKISNSKQKYVKKITYLK